VLRLYLLIVVNVLSMASTPAWIGRTADVVAVVTVCPLTGPGRRRYWRRLVAVSLVCDVVVLSILGSLYVLHLLFHPIVVFAVALAALPLVWATVTTGIEALTMGELRRAEKAVVAEALGPVHFAGGLASGGAGAGGALVNSLTKRADAEEITLIGRTERGPLVELYKRADFHVAAEATTWWGTAVLVVRPALPRGAASTTG
jgi:hypothetical protein